MNRILSAMQSTSAAGGAIFGLSLIEINALLGIILTLTSLVLLIVPKVCDLVKKIRNAAEDGKITDEEAKDILGSGKEIAKDIGEAVVKISEKTNESKDLK